MRLAADRRNVLESDLVRNILNGIHGGQRDYFTPRYLLTDQVNQRQRSGEQRHGNSDSVVHLLNCDSQRRIYVDHMKAATFDESPQATTGEVLKVLRRSKEWPARPKCNPG
jgi:hypothetical protein